MIWPMTNFFLFMPTMKFDKIKIISERENKSIYITIFISLFRWPRYISICSKYFSHFWFNNCESGSLIIAKSMECFSCESILASSKNQFKFIHLTKFLNKFNSKKLFVNICDYFVIRNTFWVKLVYLNGLF